MKKLRNQIYSYNLKIYHRNYIGIILITLGIFLLSISIFNTEKIGAVLTIIGFFLIVLKTEEKKANHSKELPILSIIIIWTMVVYVIIVITNVTVELLFFLVLIGLLVIYEFISKVISLVQKNRLHFAIFIFLMIVVVILIIKIISMSRM